MYLALTQLFLPSTEVYTFVTDNTVESQFRPEHFCRHGVREDQVETRI